MNPDNSLSDYDDCNSFVGRFAYSLLSREESFVNDKYVTQFKYNVCGDCLDDLYYFANENYQIAAPMWKITDDSENNYTNSANTFNSEDIFLSGTNLFQNEENILLSIKFNNKKFLNSVTLHESYFIHAPALPLVVGSPFHLSANALNLNRETAGLCLLYYLKFLLSSRPSYFITML